MKQGLSPEQNRRAWLAAVLIVAALVLIPAGVAGVMRLLPPTLSTDAPPPSPALMEAAAGLDTILVDAVFDPEAMLLTLTQELTLQNRTGQDQEAVVLRSWSGAYLMQETSPAASEELFARCYGEAFSPGGLRLKSAMVNGGPSIWHWLDDAMTVLSLPADWKSGEAVTVTLRCQVDIPRCASRFGYADGLFMLGNVFPVPAVWMDGAWRTDAYLAVGDPFLGECANWQLTLSVPGGYTVAATGALETLPDGRLRLTAPACRDAALVIGRELTGVSRMAGDTLVTAYARTKKDARTMLKQAIQALESYGSRWGGYAYPTLVVTEASFPYGGMEYPGLAMISTEALAMGGATLEYAVAHEVAHQWWGVITGSDGFYQPWQDEALCEYACLDYMGDVYGASIRESEGYYRIEAALNVTVPRGVTPGSPISYFSNLEEYALVVYHRGAALWTALEKYLGKPALDALLRDYHQAFRFRLATREDLTAFISQHLGQDVSALMTDYLDTHMP